MNIKFDCQHCEFKNMKIKIDERLKNKSKINLFGTEYFVKRFYWGTDKNWTKAELEVYEIKEVDISGGDYVRVTDRALENDYKLNSNFIYKVDYTRKDYGEKYLKLCGIKDTLFKEKLFERVEVK